MPTLGKDYLENLIKKLDDEEDSEYTSRDINEVTPDFRSKTGADNLIKWTNIIDQGETTDIDDPPSKEGEVTTEKFTIDKDFSFNSFFNDVGEDLVKWYNDNYSTASTYDPLYKRFKEYWNESVAKVYAEVIAAAEAIKDDPSKRYNKETQWWGSRQWNAGYDFESLYVKPDPNIINEKYLTNRNDELIEILQDDSHMDFTLDRKIYNDLSENKYLERVLTLLLMPQYERRVETEDLNRDFWVIG